MAAASTKRYAEGKPLSFMDGIPVAVKEEIDVVSCYGDQWSFMRSDIFFTTVKFLFCSIIK